MGRACPYFQNAPLVPTGYKGQNVCENELEINSEQQHEAHEIQCILDEANENHNIVCIYPRSSGLDEQEQVNKLERVTRNQAIHARHQFINAYSIYAYSPIALPPIIHALREVRDKTRKKSHCDS